MPNVSGKTTSRLEAQGHSKTIVRVVGVPALTPDHEVALETEEVATPPFPYCNARCACVWALRGLLGGLAVAGMVVVGYYLMNDD